MVLCERCLEWTKSKYILHQTSKNGNSNLTLALKTTTNYGNVRIFFPINVEGADELKWILIVSMQSVAPNGDTGTSYFVGDFDGHHFVNTNQGNAQFWLDYRTDNYAMVSWSDVPDSDGRRLMMGWMSNWLYAQKVPTERWRECHDLARK
ncbi:MAG: hypothetical protein IPL08_00160 [Saprospiraceae bacterium]|nr:hypothetical protein [Saprospiraceae bacterium]